MALKMTDNNGGGVPIEMIEISEPAMENLVKNYAQKIENLETYIKKLEECKSSALDAFNISEVSPEFDSKMNEYINCLNNTKTCMEECKNYLSKAFKEYKDFDTTQAHYMGNI